MAVGKLINLCNMFGWKFQVGNISTAVTYYMVMKICAAVKAVTTVRGWYLLHVAHIGKKIEITVYGAETDVGKFFLHMQIDGISSRMLMSL